MRKIIFIIMILAGCITLHAQFVRVNNATSLQGVDTNWIKAQIASGNHVDTVGWNIAQKMWALNMFLKKSDTSFFLHQSNLSGYATKDTVPFFHTSYNATKMRYPNDSMQIPLKMYGGQGIANIITCPKLGRSNTNSSLYLVSFIGSSYMDANYANSSNVLQSSARVTASAQLSSVSMTGFNSLGTTFGYNANPTSFSPTTQKQLGESVTPWGKAFFADDVSIYSPSTVSPLNIIVSNDLTETKVLKSIPYSTFSLSGHNHSGIYEPDLGRPPITAGWYSLVSLGNSVNRYWRLIPAEGTIMKVGVSGAIDAVTDNSANWNTAFGWGNHSGRYYIYSDTATVLLSILRASHDYSPKSHNHSGIYEPVITHGTSAQYFRGDLTLATFPSIPAAQIQSDWNQATTSALDYIKNKPPITSGTVTSVATGYGLSGGTITSTGTLNSDTTSATGLVSKTRMSHVSSYPTLNQNTTGTAAGITAQYIDWNASSGGSSIANKPSFGTVTSVTGTAPVVSSGGTTPAISMATATTTVNGYLTSTDWNTFNNKVSMVYPGAGIPLSTGSSWGTSISNNSTNWNTAYSWGDWHGAGFLTTSLAASTYLTTGNAATTYLTISNASSTYEPKIPISSTDKYWRGDKTWQTLPVSPESLWARVTGATNNMHNLNSAYVGIGVTNPTRVLDVFGGANFSNNGNSAISANGTAGYSTISATNNSSSIAIEGSNSSTGPGVRGYSGGGYGVVGASYGSNGGYFESNTNIGVSGVGNGSASQGVSGSGGNIGVYGAATNYGVYGSGGNYAAVYGTHTTGKAGSFNSGSGIALYVNSATGYGAIFETGNVGIGKTDPTNKLEVVGRTKTTDLTVTNPVLTAGAYTVTINASGTFPPTGVVTSVTGTAPVVSSGGTTPAISMAAATGSVNGYLTSTDWNTFNNKVSMTYPAAGIPLSTGSAWGTSITNNSANWNTAYGWGDWSSTVALKSPLASPTFTGTVTLPSGLSGLAKLTSGVVSTITDNSTNWTSAYNWGNHASAGYLTTGLAASTYLTISAAASALSLYATLASPTFTGIVTASSVKYTATPAIDHTTSGELISLTAAATSAIGDVGYVNSSGKVQFCKADTISNCRYALAICADPSISANASGNWLTKGSIRDATWSWTVGGLIYVSTSGYSGATLTQSAPAGSNNVVMPVGVALSTDVMYFFGNINSVEHQ